MLNLPQETFNKIKNMLHRQERQLTEEIKTIDKDDPLKGDRLAEVSEPGTESWLADVHGKVVSIKQNLETLLTNTKESLMNLKTGKYGHCQKCGKHIEVKRLEVMPTATLCLSCSKKQPKK